MSTNKFLSASVLASGLLAATLSGQSGAMKDKMGQMKEKMKAQASASSEGEMMGHHREIAQLVDKLAQTFAAIQPNAEPAVLRQKLTEHETVLKELQAMIAEHGKMMESEYPVPPDPAKPKPADPHEAHH